MPATVDQQAPLWPEQPADWRDGTPWFSLVRDYTWVPSPPFAITTATVAQQAALWPEPFVPVRGPDTWYSPAHDPVWVPSPPFAITSATAAQQAATQPDQTRLAWTDGSPWFARTDESQDSLLPPFNPALFDWAEQPQAWANPWAVTPADAGGFPPPPLLVQTDDAPATWAGPWFAVDGGADVLFTGPSTAQLSPLWADSQRLPAWPAWAVTDDGGSVGPGFLVLIGGQPPGLRPFAPQPGLRPRYEPPES